jgi:hypothetical protein
MSAKRFRLRYTFWLDLNDQEESQLAEHIDQLKTQRSFAKTIRDGIRLIADLRAGKLDVLFELFPWTGAAFLAATTQPPIVHSPSSDEIKREFASLKDLILRTNALPIGDGPVPAPQSPMALSNAPKPLNVPKFELPRFDDDDDTLVIEKDTRTDSAQNFLNSMLRLEQ